MPADVLLVDVSWDVNALLAYELVAAGFRVHVAGRALRRSVRRLPLASVTELEAYRPTQLGDLVRARGIDAVLACTEEGLEVVDRERPHIAARVLPAYSAAARPLLADKDAFLVAAEAWGVAVPERIPLAGADDCPAAVASLGLPVVIKGARGYGGATVRICRSVDEARAAIDALTAVGAGPASAQRFYGGGMALAGAVADAGRANAVYTSLVRAQAPPGIGPSVVIESVEDHALAEAVETIVGRLEWIGALSCDFVLDDRGRPLLIDVNPRLWGAAWAARRAGVDVFGALAALLRGDPIPPAALRPGVRVRVFPKYTELGGAAGLSLAARIRGLRDAPWRHPGFMLRETGALVARRLARP